MGRPTRRPPEGAAEPLPPLPHLLALGQEALYRLAGPGEAAAPSGFGADSPAYHWASEFPARALRALAPQLGPPALTIAGSGDNCIELLRLGLWPLLAVDVSRAACYVNELKAQALAQGVARADFMAGLLPAPRPELLERLAPSLTPAAAAFWRRAAEGRGAECASLLERRPHLPLLAYLATEEDYREACARACPWPLLNLPLEAVLARTRERFGTIYVSNVGEYIQRASLMADRESEVAGRLLDLWGLVAARLAPGGVALAYLFEGEERARGGPEAGAMAAAGLTVRLFPVEFERLGTRFHHCLLAGRRAAAPS